VTYGKETRPERAWRCSSSSPAEQPDTKERIGISIRMDGDTHDELRRISYETRTSIQKLVMQGIKGVVGKHPAKGK